jgi:hypothetical protein
MIHEVSSGVIGHVDDMKVEAKEVERLNIQVMTQLAEKMGMTFQQLKQKINVNGRRELYLTAQEAKELGLIHSVGLPLIKPIIMYSVETIPPKKIMVEEAVSAKVSKTRTKTVSKNKKKKKK